MYFQNGNKYVEKKKKKKKKKKRIMSRADSEILWTVANGVSSCGTGTRPVKQRLGILRGVGLG